MAEGLSSIARDESAIRTGLDSWLHHWRPGAEGLRIVAMAQNPNNGFSNDSIFLTIESVVAGAAAREELVVRAPPRGDRLYPDFDLEAQARAQDLVARNGVPAAPPLAYEPDTRWIGAPFLVMPKIEGRVPPDDPHYSLSGWLFDAPPAQQRALYLNTLDVMADIHRVDLATADAGFLARAGGAGLRAELAWWEDFVRWAAGDAMPAVVSDGLDWLRKTMPLNEPPASIVWGDARLGNIIFDVAMRPTAVLDWEMASIGPAELDVGYFLAYERRTRERLQIAGDRELPGFPTREEAVAHYERRLGRPLRDLAWYEVFAMLRLAGFMLRVQGIMRSRGLHDHFVMQRPVMQDWCLALMQKTV